MVNLLTSTVNAQIQIPIPYRFFISPQQVRKTLQYCKEFLGQKMDQDLSVIYTNIAKIRTINRKYRKIDKPTDVLSFSMDLVDPETGRNNLGDIFISVPMAREQAHRLNHSLKQELTLLLIHGYLHLNGYDHDTEATKKKMWSIQEKIFSGVMASK